MGTVTESTCGVIGLGYVGLTLALNFDRAGYETIGYDIDERKIASLQRDEDITGEFDGEAIRDSDVTFTSAPRRLGQCEYVFIALPTPVTEAGVPDLSGIEAACETVGRFISDGTVIVVESTVYPGATKEVVKPAVERGTTAQGGARFHLGYSPERIVPGGGVEFTDVTKVVSADEETIRRDLAELYDSIIDADVHLAESIETAEASKCLENLQRDVNIGLVNEFTMACRRLDFDLDPHAVLKAARTKWNFHDYRPGIVGGHCIPVDPHYLRYAFEQAGYDARLLRVARSVNQQMITHVRSITVAALCEAKVARTVPIGSAPTLMDSPSLGPLPDTVSGSDILLLGFGYKPNVSDVRNSGVVEIAEGLDGLGFTVRGYDPFHDIESVPNSFTFEVQSRLTFDKTDAIVLLTPHDELCNLDLGVVASQMNDNPVLVDVESVYTPAKARTSGFTYRRV